MEQKIDLTRLKLSGLTAPIIDLQPLPGGGNNRVYRLRLDDGSFRLLKRYFRDEHDPRDRLKTEYGACTFLWDHGLRCIPQPLGCDEENGYALFEFVNGEKYSPNKLGEFDIDQVLNFVKSLRDLARIPEARFFLPASEAAFSLTGVLEILDRRLVILGAAAEESAALRTYLNDRLLPFYLKARANAEADMPQGELEECYRTLSPSDLGFHNAIRSASGHWIFQDFEYFGRDDPAKLIIDFELHPAMALDADLAAMWRQGTLKIFSSDPQLKLRLKLLYPLYGIKWCVIVLNEFVPEYRARRGFAGKIAADASERQLEKASAILTNLEKA